MERIPTPEAPWLDGETEGPLQADALEYWRCLTLHARDEVERGAYTKEHCRDVLPVHGHPALLLRAPQRYKDDLRSRPADVFNILAALSRFTEWGRHGV